MVSVSCIRHVNSLPEDTSFFERLFIPPSRVEQQLVRAFVLCNKRRADDAGILAHVEFAATARKGTLRALGKTLAGIIARNVEAK